MGIIIKARIIKIGNSQGIRIPKPMIEQAGLGEEVELEVQQDQIVLRPSKHVRLPREGWEEQIRLLVKRGDDKLLDGDTLPPTQWDVSEWEW